MILHFQCDCPGLGAIIRITAENCAIVGGVRVRIRRHLNARKESEVCLRFHLSPPGKGNTRVALTIPAA